MLDLGQVDLNLTSIPVGTLVCLIGVEGEWFSGIGRLTLLGAAHAAYKALAGQSVPFDGDFLRRVQLVEMNVDHPMVRFDICQSSEARIAKYPPKPQTGDFIRVVYKD